MYEKFFHTTLNLSVGGVCTVFTVLVISDITAGTGKRKAASCIVCLGGKRGQLFTTGATCI